eukprot:2739459-Alexandrium_andersonii.AAC.1
MPMFLSEPPTQQSQKSAQGCASLAILFGQLKGAIQFQGPALTASLRHRLPPHPPCHSDHLSVEVFVREGLGSEHMRNTNRRPAYRASLPAA